MTGAAFDPRLIRAYDDPDDGRYLLAADIEAWLRDLAEAARAGDPISQLLHAPVLDRMADSVHEMGESA